MHIRINVNKTIHQNKSTSPLPTTSMIICLWNLRSLPVPSSTVLLYQRWLTPYELYFSASPSQWLLVCPDDGTHQQEFRRQRKGRRKDISFLTLLDLHLVIPDSSKTLITPLFPLLPQLMEF